ncbi:MAG: hypothetical protein IJR59_01485, partial [Firmicutes bacterium]|nr:hypothetical protein [Bacillota bacterium]
MNEKDLPIFETPFKVRVQNCWKLFLEKENELRLLMDNKASSDEVVRKLDELISPAFNYVYAEVGKNNDKYELILNLDGDKSRAFPLIYFKNNAPKEVFEHWNILIGRQASQKNMDKLKLRMGGSEVEASDIDLWCEWNNNLASVSVYCEKLLPLIKENENQAYN